MLTGFLSVDDEGVAPGNNQLQLVGLLMLKSVKLAHTPSQITVLLEEKPAMGGSQERTVIKTGLLILSIPWLLTAVKLTL